MADVMSQIQTIEDLRRLARRRTPKMFYDYVDGGSWTESTYRANEQDLAKIAFRQRVCVNIEQRSLRSQMAGMDVSMPVALAPIGMCGLMHADGEIHAARAAKMAGVPFCLSTMSICSIEDVAQNVKEPFWFQLYMMRDRAFVESLIRRAYEANCSALILTLDLQIMGDRHKDARNGLSAPPKISPRFVLELIRKPHWCFTMAQTSRRGFGNIVGHVAGVSDVTSLSEWTQSQFDPTLTWADVAWVRKLWKGKLILKGIMDEDDARRAIDLGADAIIVSNHGGRQLDGAPSSISVLPKITHVTGKACDIFFDGGIRSGQDVLRAMALGARGVFLGRAYVYGLGALGEAGVRLCLNIIEREISLTMGFCGQTDINKLSADMLML